MTNANANAGICAVRRMKCSFHLIKLIGHSSFVISQFCRQNISFSWHAEYSITRDLFCQTFCAFGAFWHLPFEQICQKFSIILHVSHIGFATFCAFARYCVQLVTNWLQQRNARAQQGFLGVHKNNPPPLSPLVTLVVPWRVAKATAKPTAKAAHTSAATGANSVAVYIHKGATCNGAGAAYV